MELRFFDDPVAFLDVAGDVLAEQPVLSTVLAGVAERIAIQREAGIAWPDGVPCWFAAVLDGDDVVGTAMRTAPFGSYPAYLMPMPDDVVHLLAKSLLDRDEPVLIKETRLYDKLEAVRGLAPEDAVLVHVVRDPRAVAVSMMTGKSRSRAYATAYEFFAEREKRKLWSSRALSRILLQRPEYAHVRRPANFERILLVWKHTFESTRREGRLLFGDRYVLLRNEELRADPVAAIARVYEAARRETPSAVAEWARGKVREPEVPFAATDPRWSEAFTELDMGPALHDAGYAQLAESVGEPPAGHGGLRRLLGRRRS